MVDQRMPSEQWSTREEIAAAHARFESAIPHWEAPQAYGVGRVIDDETVFPVVNVQAHYLPAVVLATVCGHSRGTAVYLLSAERLGRAIALLAPAEACADYEHPNLRAWRSIREAIAGTGESAVAVFVARTTDPVIDAHDARFRGLLPAPGGPSHGRPGAHPGDVSDTAAGLADFSEVDRAPTPVMFLEVPDSAERIAGGWERLEELVGDLRGRRLLGMVQSERGAYRACVQTLAGDRPDQLGLSVCTVPGGRYLRFRLLGDPPGVYRRIAPATQRLARTGRRDDSRPIIEHFRQRNEIDILMPLAGS